jgi:hypothetical protein
VGGLMPSIELLRVGLGVAGWKGRVRAAAEGAKYPGRDAVAKRHTSRRRKRRNQLACLAARSRPEWQVDYGKDGTSGAILDKRRLLGE